MLVFFDWLDVHTHMFLLHLVFMRNTKGIMNFMDLQSFQYLHLYEGCSSSEAEARGYDESG
jgi:hypothetical protein